MSKRALSLAELIVPSSDPILPPTQARVDGLKYCNWYREEFKKEMRKQKWNLAGYLPTIRREDMRGPDRPRCTKHGFFMSIADYNDIHDTLYVGCEYCADEAERFGAVLRKRWGALVQNGRTIIKKECPVCGVVFEVPLARKRNTYCSRRCSWQAARLGINWNGRKRKAGAE